MQSTPAQTRLSFGRLTGKRLKVQKAAKHASYTHTSLWTGGPAGRAGAFYGTTKIGRGRPKFFILTHDESGPEKYFIKAKVLFLKSNTFALIKSVTFKK